MGNKGKHTVVLSLASWIKIVISQEKLLVGGVGTPTRQGPRVAVGQIITNLKVPMT